MIAAGGVSNVMPGMQEEAEKRIDAGLREARPPYASKPVPPAEGSGQRCGWCDA
jgi:hypothetical protein